MCAERRGYLARRRLERGGHDTGNAGTRTRGATMIQALWNRHYHATGSYHGDMAHAFKAILADSDCDHLTRRKMLLAISHHQRVELSPRYTGRRWFCEAFNENTGN